MGVVILLTLLLLPIQPYFEMQVDDYAIHCQVRKDSVLCTWRSPTGTQVRVAPLVTHRVEIQDEQQR
jgi:hypothetical protein